jgi:hypothetical protein
MAEPSGRQVTGNILRALTIMLGDDGGSPGDAGWLQSRFDLIEMVNDTEPFSLRIGVPLSDSALARLDRQIQNFNLMRRQESVTHLMINISFLDWLLEATRLSRNEILQRITLEVTSVTDEIFAAQDDQGQRPS